MNDKFVDMPKCMADKYETADFIASDPVQFPRRYSIGAAEMRKCLDKIFDLAIDERLK